MEAAKREKTIGEIQGYDLLVSSEVKKAIGGMQENNLLDF